MVIGKKEMSSITFSNKGVMGVFCSGSLVMMLLMCGSMVTFATVLPSATPLSIISASLFGPMIIAIGMLLSAYKVNEVHPELLRLAAE